MMMAKKRKAASFTKIQIISNSFVNLSWTAKVRELQFRTRVIPSISAVQNL
jgi:hypothetical protein